MKSRSRMPTVGILVGAVILAVLLECGIALAQSAEEGIANFYSDKFQGKKMASGEVYDKNKLTASHNNKSVVITMNDRMGQENPAVIDVTRRGAEELGFVKAGKARVKLETE